MMKPSRPARRDRTAPVDAGDGRHPEAPGRPYVAMNRHSQGRRATSVILCMFFAILCSCCLGATAARAACDALGQGPPIKGTIKTGATSLQVSWLPQCPSVPPSMHLVLGGSSSNGSDGRVIGQQNNLTQFENAGAIPTDVPLITNHRYDDLRLCAVYSAKVAYCGVSFSATPIAQPTTPTPVITTVTPTQNSIAYQWESSVQYTSYNVRITGRPQGSTQALQYTWPDLDAGSPYTISVQGCNFAGVGAAACYGWASRTVSTLPATPVTELGPVNLHTIIDQSDVQVLWTDPSQGYTLVQRSRSPGWSSNPAPPVFNGNSVSWKDAPVTTGTTYTYKVCLIGATGATACATTTAVLPSPCQFAKTCPFYENQPPQYALTCPQPVDFYSWSGTPLDATTPPPSGMNLLSSRQTSIRGSTTGEAVFAAACNPGTRNQCVSYSIDVDAGHWCHPQHGLPPPPPPKNPVKLCMQCRDNGGICLKSGATYVCKGTLQ